MHQPNSIPNYFLALRFYSRLPHQNVDQKVFDLLSFLESGIQPSGRGPDGPPKSLRPDPDIQPGPSSPWSKRGVARLPLAKEAIEPPINANSAQQAPHDARPGQRHRLGVRTASGQSQGVCRDLVREPRRCQYCGRTVERDVEVRDRTRGRRGCPVVTRALGLCVSYERDSRRNGSAPWKHSRPNAEAVIGKGTLARQLFALMRQLCDSFGRFSGGEH